MTNDKGQMTNDKGQMTNARLFNQKFSKKLEYLAVASGRMAGDD
ncbi:hypothetical protein [[Phormidium] sp. ETS-05]|nr:hypothetical protein [[Phormidium] sp. ETS-05]